MQLCVVAIATSQLVVAAHDSKQQPDDSSEEEELGRAGAFGPKKTPQKQADFLTTGNKSKKQKTSKSPQP